MFAAAAVAGVHAARRRQAEQAIAGMLADPAPLWHRNDELMQPVWLLFVYIQDISLVHKLANTRLQLRVRYGNNGCYQEKYSQKVRSSTPLANEQAGADFESMFVYPWSRTLEPCIMIDLVKLGFIDWTISTGAMHIPFGEGNAGAIDQDVLFFGKKGEDGFIGQMNVFIEVRSISRAELELGIDRVRLTVLDMAVAASLGELHPLGPGLMAPMGVLGPPRAGIHHHHAGASIGGTPVVLGHAMPRANTVGLGIVQGSAVDSAVFAGSVAPSGSENNSSGHRRQPSRERLRPAQERFRDHYGGQVRHVTVARRSEGTEHRPDSHQ